MKEYAVETEVQVYYDPDNPAMAILECDTGTTNKSHYIFPGCIMVLAGVVVFALKIIVKNRG